MTYTYRKPVPAAPQPAPEPAVQGSVSHGTLRSQDLFPAFLSALQDLGGPDHARLEAEYQVTKALGHLDTEQGDDLLNEIIDDINDVLPEGWHFGSLEGDGSDFGVWKNEDEDDQ